MNPVRKNTNRDKDMSCPLKHKAELSNGMKKKILEKKPNGVFSAGTDNREIVKVPRGEWALLKDRCKSCGFCIEFCPKKVLEFSSESNVKGYRIPMVKNPEKCILCGFCSMYCPDFAIYQTKDDKAGKKQ